MEEAYKEIFTTHPKCENLTVYFRGNILPKKELTEIKMIYDSRNVTELVREIAPVKFKLAVQMGWDWIYKQEIEDEG